MSGRQKLGQELALWKTFMADPLADRSQGSRVLGNDCAVAFRSGIDRQVCLRRGGRPHYIRRSPLIITASRTICKNTWNS